MTNTLDILEKLVGFDTVSAGSNLPLIDYVDGILSARGFIVTRVPDDTGQKAGLFASLGPRTGRKAEGILLSAHSDVVPVAGQAWARDPFRLSRDGDRVYGRGTTDMKGYLAAMLALADRAAQATLREPLLLSISYDEEIGCVGIQHMIGRLPAAIGQPRACFVGEPTEMRVATGHKGKAALRAVCHGQSGHSALAPQFVSALDLAADFVAALRGLQDDLRRNGARDPAYDVPYSTVHIGRMWGGTALNIVPDRAELLFEFRHLAADPAEDLDARIVQAAERVAARYRPRFEGARIEVEHCNAYPGLDVPQDAAVAALAQRLSGSAVGTKVAFGTEAGVFDRLGIPTGAQTRRVHHAGPAWRLRRDDGPHPAGAVVMRVPMRVLRCAKAAAMLQNRMLKINLPPAIAAG